MQIATSKILELLETDNPVEVRTAAAVVLGELGVRDAEIGSALCERLKDDDRAVRLQAIRAVGKLKVDQALPQLLARFKDGGDEAEQAALAVARLGPKGTRALQDLMPKVAPGLRRYIASALAAGGTSSAESAALEMLLDKDPGVIEAAVRTIAGQIPTLTPSHRKSMVDHLLGLLEGKDTPLSPASSLAAVRLLNALDDPRAEASLWERVEPPHSPEMRSAALHAVGKWVEKPTKERLRKLLECAADRDFRVAAPALMILKGVEVPDRAVAEWLPLLQAPDVAARQLAMEKLGDRDTADVAEGLLKQLEHPDRSLRESALARLTKLNQGRKALTNALKDAETADRAWPLARAQARFAKDYPPAWRDGVFAQASEYLEAGDRRSDPLLFLLREADEPDLRQRLEQRALALRKKKNYAAALLYLRLLVREPSAGFAIRFELAACGLKESSRDLTPEARQDDPCLNQWSYLCQNYESELLEELRKCTWLDADELYYLGFHFVEGEGRAKHFGTAVLQLLLKRSPKSKVAQSAKSKLKNEGVEVKKK